MSRPIRIYYPGLIYHILNRGNNRQVVFVEDNDYQHYLDILQKYKEKFDFKIFAYCLMTNHVHLLLQVSERASISKIMQAITIAHTRYYHYKYQASGHVWQGRFKSPIISDDEYLLTTMRYIEQNPIRAGIVKDLRNYPYLSFPANSKPESSNFIDKEQNPVYNSLGRNPEERANAYTHLALAVLGEQRLQEVRDSLIGKFHYISERFQQEIKEKLTRKRRRGRPRKQRIYS
jgi:putative transposase